MSSSPSKVKRFRYAILAEKLKSEIEQGVYPLGGKLPSERALAQKYDVTHITVRQCFGVLERQGLITRTPGSGTYVNASLEKPIVAVIFGPKLTVESAHIYRALLASFEGHLEALSYRCRSYDGFNGANPEIADQHPAYQALLNDAQNHRFIGYIKVSVDEPAWGQMRPLEGLPFTSYGLLKSEFTHDYYGFAKDCVEYAVQCGFRKLLYVRGISTISDDLKGLKESARRCHIDTPECLQLADGDVGIRPDAMAHLEIRRLVKQWRKTNNWPDAILVSDDIVTRGVALGLIEAGNEVVQRVAVITHVNEGIEHHYGIPTIRYAFSPEQAASHLCERLQERISNPALPVQATFSFRGRVLGGDHSLSAAQFPAFGMAIR